MQMIADTQAFGKLDRGAKDDARDFHPLTDHMTDVAACFARLARCRSIRRAMDTSAGRRLTQIDLDRLSVLVFLHDVGKANSGFQAKRWPQRIPAGWPVQITAGHGLEAFKLFEVSSAAAAIEPLIQEICGWGAASNTLLIASISHHGRPLKDKPGASISVWKSVSGSDYDPVPPLREIATQAKSLYPRAFQAGDQALPDSDAFAHLFAGLVQLADWMGSDTRFFSFSLPGEVRGETAPILADRSVTALGLDAENWRQRVVDTAPVFADAFGFGPPRPIQTAMGDDHLGRLVILESETGSGKTEAALWRYLHLFQQGEVDSLYFALPTRVAATQLYRRVHDTLQRLWPKNPPLALRALPGYVATDGVEAIALPDFKVLWTDNQDDQMAPQRWAGENAKRFLAAPVAVGTIDQVLLAVLQVPHAHLRHATLARSLLVVDEVHASDAYMTVLLEQLLKTHLNCGGHAVLLSATLGSTARSRYLALAPQERAMKPMATTFDTACQIPYPALSDHHGIVGIEGTGKSKSVHWTTQDNIDSPEKIADLALTAATHGAKVLIIRNTVPAALATLAALESLTPDQNWLFQVRGVVTLHHSRFSRQDRPILDAAIEARLGKGRVGGPLIVVGTQTLEQSLDIDADFLITDICPMDVLLQRIGRLHRHINERPDAYRTAQAVVLTPAGNDLSPLLAKSKFGLGRFHNGGGVYDDLRVVEATRRLLVEMPAVCIPDNNRYLVEAATHPDRLHALAAELGAVWQAQAEKLEGDTSAEKAVGRLHMLDTTQEFGEFEFPTGVQIATRLGAQDRVVNFDPPLPGPFGESLKALPIRHHLLPKDLPLDADATAIQADDNGIAFQLGGAAYRYSRLGLERLKDQ